MQASGLPVITTDVRALPEINQEQCGWILPVCEEFDAQISPLEEADKRESFSKRLENLLVDSIEGILLMPRERLVNRAKRAIARIEQNHNPANHKTRLLAIIEQT